MPQVQRPQDMDTHISILNMNCRKTLTELSIGLQGPSMNMPELYQNIKGAAEQEIERQRLQAIPELAYLWLSN